MSVELSEIALFFSCTALVADVTVACPRAPTGTCGCAWSNAAEVQPMKHIFNQLPPPPPSLLPSIRRLHLMVSNGFRILRTIRSIRTIRTIRTIFRTTFRSIFELFEIIRMFRIRTVPTIRTIFRTIRTTFRTTRTTQTTRTILHDLNERIL